MGDAPNCINPPRGTQRRGETNYLLMQLLSSCTNWLFATPLGSTNTSISRARFVVHTTLYICTGLASTSTRHLAVQCLALSPCPLLAVSRKASRLRPVQNLLVVPFGAVNGSDNTSVYHPPGTKFPFVTPCPACAQHRPRTMA